MVCSRHSSQQTNSTSLELKHVMMKQPLCCHQLKFWAQLSIRKLHNQKDNIPGKKSNPEKPQKKRHSVSDGSNSNTPSIEGQQTLTRTMSQLCRLSKTHHFTVFLLHVILLLKIDSAD